MAESKNNIVTFGLSGLVGDLLVFTKRAGKTIVSRKPDKSSVPPTPLQISVRERFREAVQYAKSILSIPAAKAMYEEMTKPGQSAFNLAMADVWKAPQIFDVVVTQYTGLVGSTVTVDTVDRYKVVSVEVSIFTEQDVLIEKGMAVMQENGRDWVYTATVVNNNPDGCIVRALAKDRPGNEANLERLVQL
ncbi:hypothetical protein HNQ91_003993 [Filimonas zeae]|uniref:Uncharacterized protein n=1 Tax=Filimonas zeae TaxID=1737353 RepID=A0A917MYE2_9BACT|nr:hypothetical protein [Filimonas zeae]MDR6340920.1 hypothetical protein [Filimonas zeae]GGH77942.1 hypothetical protein GCM10011379_45050 [Filimonas zeae]